MDRTMFKLESVDLVSGAGDDLVYVRMDFSSPGPDRREIEEIEEDEESGREEKIGEGPEPELLRSRVVLTLIDREQFGELKVGETYNINIQLVRMALHPEDQL